MSSWEAEVELAAIQYADEHIEEEKIKNKLLCESAVRKRLILEFTEACLAKELSAQITRAIKIINLDGPHYLDKTQWQSLQIEMMRAADRMATSEFDPRTTTFQELLGFSDNALESIEMIAAIKYEENALHECLALYAFLNTLNEDNSAYWLRLAIILQELGEIKQAIQTYEMAIEFDPTNIGAYLFSAECQIALGNKSEANTLLEKAKQLIEEQHAENAWFESLSELQTNVN